MAFGINAIPPMWYVWVIIGCYIAFYFVFRYMPEAYRVTVFDVVVAVYCIASMVLNPAKDEMYASISGICVGIHYAKKQEYKDQKQANLLRLTIAFFVLFIGRLGLSWVGMENLFLHTVLRNVITICFVLIIAELSAKIDIRSKCLKWMGRISYEIYLIHPFVLYAIKELSLPKAMNNIVSVLGTLAITFLLAALLHTICEKATSPLKHRQLRI